MNHFLDSYNNFFEVKKSNEIGVELTGRRTSGVVTHKGNIIGARNT